MVRLGTVMKAVAQLEKQESPAAGIEKGQVLHQTKKGRAGCPVVMMMGGVAVIATLAYFTLYSHKKPEATALDVAKVTTGMATPENAHPRK